MSIASIAILIGSKKPDPTYAVGQSSTSINEGSTVTFTVSTTYVSNGTTLYWTINSTSGTVNGSDFSDGATSGSFTINSGTGSVSRTLTSDTSSEGNETFQFQVRTGSTSGTIVATSSTITINDTSVNSQPFSASYVIIGGGGGGARFNGGGGAGAYRSSSSTLQSGVNYSITIGAVLLDMLVKGKMVVILQRLE